MRKLFALLMVLAIVLSITACGKSSQESIQDSSTAPASQAPTSQTPASSEDDDTAAVTKPEGYPSGNISYIVPAAAGAPIDIPVRAMVDMMDLGANIVIENIAGAAQTIGTLEAFTRKGDGYTLLSGANAGMLIQPHLNEVAYTLDDFRHIAMTAGLNYDTIIVHPDSPLQNADDFMELLRGTDRFTWGAPAASHAYLAVSYAFQQLGSENGAFISYGNGAESIAAVMGKAVDFAVVDDPDAFNGVKAGNVRAIVIMADEKSPLFPDLPFIEEYGLENMGSFKALKWLCIKADTPDEIVEWLKQEVNAVIQSDEYQQYLETSGLGRVEYWSEEQLTEFLKQSSATCAEVIEKLDSGG